MPDRLSDRLTEIIAGLCAVVILILQFGQGQVFAAGPFTTVETVVEAPAPTPIAWPTWLGPDDADYTIEVTVLRATVAPSRGTTHVDGATLLDESRMYATLASAEQLIRSWSGGTVRVRFAITVSDTPVPLVRARGDEWYRWPNPRAIAAPAPETDMRLVIWSDNHDIAGASLAGATSVDGRLVPYLSIPIDETGDSVLGERIVHEFCHGLETLSRFAGRERPELHDTGRYGFTHDEQGSWGDWYAFYLTHPTVAEADAAGRTPTRAEPMPGR